jgi:glycosyltransferase involved in cell wall biosynthesis
MRYPLISVLMPAFNSAKHLDEAIDSILSQTYNNFEFIIINDGSTDRTKEIILSFNDKRIIYFENTHNLGLIKTLNLGLNICRGEYIARMDSDDIAHPDRLNAQVRFMLANPNIGVCGCFIKYFGEEVSFWKPPINNHAIKAELLNGSPFCHPSVMIKKEVLIKNKIKYSDSFLHAEDYFMWYELSKVTDFHNLPEFLLMYRSSENQISQKYNQLQKSKKNEIQSIVLNDYNIDILQFEENMLCGRLDFVKYYKNVKKIKNQLVLKFGKNYIYYEKSISMYYLSNYIIVSDIKINDLVYIIRSSHYRYYSFRMRLGLIKKTIRK